MDNVVSEDLFDDGNRVSPILGSDSKPPHAHVPPRIDPDLYQADVPDWSPRVDEEPAVASQQLTDSGLNSKSVHSEKHCNSTVVQEFLTNVRNLLDPVRPRGQSFWTNTQSEIPLETDVFALEYLSSYDYDVDKAMFNLFCDFGRGKDAVFAGKSLSVVERTASNVIFTDLKDRLLKIPPSTLFGAYYGSFNAAGHRQPSEESRGSVAAASVTSALLATSAEGEMLNKSDFFSAASAGAGATGSCQGHINAQPPHTKYAIFSPIITQPMQQALAEQLLAQPRVQVLPAAGTDEPVSKKARGNTGGGGASRKKEKDSSNGSISGDSKVSSATITPAISSSAISSSALVLTEDAAGALSDSASAVSSVAVAATEEPAAALRVSKQRGASSDKVELRRKWVSVAQRAAYCLGQNNHSKATLAEAQALLDLACTLPAHHTIMGMGGGSVVSSTTAAGMSTSAVAIATEEAAMLDNAVVLLGKLVKAVLTVKYWVSEVRDAIYCCSLDAVILSHQTELRNRSGRKGTAESLMNGLRELLKESDAHALRADPEQRLLVDTISATDALLQQTRSVLRECCAWEAQSTSASSSCVTAGAGGVFRPAEPVVVDRSLVVRGRPELYTAPQIRSLLQQHIAAVSEAHPFVPSPVAKRPSMEQVGDLLRQAQLNPVKISETVYLESVHRQGLQLVDMAATILTRAAQLAVAKSRLTLDRVRYPLVEVQNLLENMHVFPFRSAEVDGLQALVSRAEAWRKEVVSISGGALSGTSTEGAGAGTGAEQGAKAQNNRTSRKTEAANKPIPLKKVEALIAEGERFPFELKDELELLRDKKQQAKLWLEKLKRSFVPTKVGISRSKKSSSGGDDMAVTEKLSLTDMKMMVSEGESLYQQPLEEDVDFAGAAGVLAATAVGRPAASARTVNRELDKAQAVVEIAEDWIARVRDIFMSEEEGSADHQADSSATASKEGGDADGDADANNAGDEGESSDGGGEEGQQERTMQMLRAMLDEAEGMPVTLDECGLLRCQLQALEWAARVRPLLSVTVPPFSAEEDPAAAAAVAVVSKAAGDQQMMEVEEGGDGNTADAAEDKATSNKRRAAGGGAGGGANKRDGNGKQASRKGSSLPRLAEMQQFAKDITRIRSNMNALGGSSDLPLKPLPEETKCLAVVADAERWRNKVNKILQGNSVRKGSKLSRLRLLCDEGSAIPIHFEAELRPLRAAIAAATHWAETYRAQLVALGLYREDSDADGADAAEGAEAEGEEDLAENGAHCGDRKRKAPPSEAAKASAASGASVPMPVAVVAVAGVADELRAEVSYGDLSDMVTSAAQLVADFDLTRAVFELATEVERWVAKVGKICKSDARATPRKAAAAAEAAIDDDSVTASTAADADSSESRAAKRPKKGFGDEGDAAGAAVTTANSATAASASSSHSTMVTVAQLDALVAQGMSFGVNLSAHIGRLEEAKQRAQSWERAAQQYIAAQYSEQLKKLLVEYKRLITDYTAAENGAIFSFIVRKPSAVTNHNIAKAYKEENAVFQRATALLAEVLAVRAQGESIGVEMPFHRTIVVYIRLLEWVIESRNVTCYQTVNRRKSAVQQGHGQGQGQGARPRHSSAQHTLTSWAGWEDMREPAQVKHWGDVDEALLLALLGEGEDLLGKLYCVAQDERIPGLVVHYNRGLLAAASEFRREEPESADVDADGDGDGDSDDGDESGGDNHSDDGNAGGGEGDTAVDTVDGSAEPNGKSSSASAASAKKKSASKKRKSSSSSQHQHQQQSPLSAKSTRAASGITKKKVDSEFAETVNLQHYNSYSSAAVSLEDAPKSSKRQKTSKLSSEDSHASSAAAGTSSAPELQPPVVSLHELDLDRTGRRAALSALLNSASLATTEGSATEGASQAAVGTTTTVKLTPGMAQLVDLWVRVLKVYALRLRTSNKWVAEARTLLSALGTGLAGQDNSDGGVAGASSGATNSSTTAVVKGNPNIGEEIERLLAVAASEGILNKYRSILEESVHNSKEWLKQAEKMRVPGAALLTMDELKQFLKAGESVIYVSQRNAELHELRAELKRAKQWKARLDKSGITADSAASASSEVLSELIAEAKQIRVNLTEHTDSIVQVNQTYCLCRQPYHGTMVGCDTCEEWYHFMCVGLSASQAEKCAKYVCVRCALRNSFSQSANMVAQLTNKWMNCAEHFRRREETFQKLAKKLYKDDKELTKLKANLRVLLDNATAAAQIPAEVAASIESVLAVAGGVTSSASITTPAAAGASVGPTAAAGVPAAASETAMDVVSSPPIGGTTSVAGSGAGAGVAVDASTATATGVSTGVVLGGSAVEKLIAARREVEVLAHTVAKAAAEKDKLNKTISTETALHREIFRWMQAMQELLWPSTDEQVALGKPVGPGNVSGNVSGSGGSGSSSSSVDGGVDPLASTPTPRASASTEDVSVLEHNRSLLAHLSSLLPVGLVHMERAAALVGILALDDVTVVLDAFRWMSWTNLCLHLLRLPPTTAALRRLLDAAKGLRCADDKILKVLLGLQQRAGSWKAKARKTLNPQQKKLDLARFQTLALEGIGLPFTSRIKEKLRGILSSHPQGWVVPAEGAAVTSEATGGADGTAKGKRGAKAASSAPADATAGGGISAVSSESWAARIVASGVEECVSSDEEDAYERVIAEQASGNAFAAMPSGVYRHEYSLVGAGVMGEAPEPLWPPQLLVARRRPTVSAVNSANASATGTNSVTGTGSSSANVSFSVSGALAAAAGVVLQDDTAAVEGRVAGAASNVATAP